METYRQRPSFPHLNGARLFAPRLHPGGFRQPSHVLAKPPSSAASLKTMLDNSCTLGLFKLQDDGSTEAKRTPIGMARMVTDYVTLAYLTDVYVVEEYRAFGLGKWLIHCCREMVQDIPDLRWMILLTGSEQAERMYRRELGMEVMGAKERLVAMGARKADLQAAGAGESQPPGA